MSDQAIGGGERRVSPWRIAGWGLAALLLLLPLVAMQFTNEVNWTGSDFVFAAVLFGSVGGVIELAVRMTRNRAYRAGVGLAAAAAFFIVWINGAVGMIGGEDNGYNLLFLGAIAVAILGAVVVRGRAAGMAAVMAAAAALHVGVALFGATSDLRGGILAALFAAPWLLSAALFRKSAHDQAAR